VKLLGKEAISIIYQLATRFLSALSLERLYLEIFLMIRSGGLWDPREKLSCLLASVSSAMLIGWIHCALARSSDAPYLDAQKFVSVSEEKRSCLGWKE
jgi:hypothetical protein